MYSAYNVGMGVYGPYPPQTNGPITWWANTTVFNMQVAVLLCPSDTAAAQAARSPITWPTSAGRSCSTGTAGRSSRLNPWSTLQRPRDATSRPVPDEPEQPGRSASRA